MLSLAAKSAWAIPAWICAVASTAQPAPSGCQQQSVCVKQQGQGGCPAYPPALLPALPLRLSAWPHTLPGCLDPAAISLLCMLAPVSAAED